MISLIIPTYRNPEYLDICLRSAVGGRVVDSTEILVVVDGYVEESQSILDKYKGKIKVLPLEQNQGMQMALNLGVFNAINENIMIINDDNVLCIGWDSIWKDVKEGEAITINRIEPTGPGIFNFPVKDFGRNPSEFDYDGFMEYETSLEAKEDTPDGGIFPFILKKKNYMMVGGFDTLYQSPFICDWDFFLKLDLAGVTFKRSHEYHFYHFGSAATKNGKESDKFKATENPAAHTYIYKWGMVPELFENNSHRPSGKEIKGIKF